MKENGHSRGNDVMVAAHLEGQKRNLENPYFRFSIRFNYLLFPFDIVELVGELAKTGYEITMPCPPKHPPPNVRLGATGKIARKGEIEIDIDARGVLGAESTSPASSIKALSDILQLVKKNLNVDLHELAAFYELIANFEIKTGKNSLESIEQISHEGPFAKQFSEILNRDVSDYTLRLVPRGRMPNQTEWFDITIEPNVIKPFSNYRIGVVYRSKDRVKVEEFTQGLLQNIIKIIDIIES